MPRISELPALAQATSGDIIPIVDDAGNITKKVTANKVVPDGSIITNQLANNAVTTAKIDSDSFTYQNYSPTVTGFSGTPTVTAKQKIVPGGRWVYINISGTSNAAVFSFTLPTAATDTINLPARVMNAGSILTNPGLVEISGNTASVFQDQTGSPFTNGGSKRIYNFLFFYS